MKKLLTILTLMGIGLTGCQVNLNKSGNYSYETNEDGSTPAITATYDYDMLYIQFNDLQGDEEVVDTEVSPYVEKYDLWTYKIPSSSNNERVCIETTKRWICDTVHR